MAFGDRLREARKAKGMTQKQLADHIGIAESTLTGYEKGNREPDLFKIKRMVEALGITADFLFETGPEHATGKNPIPPTGEELSQAQKDLIHFIRMLDDETILALLTIAGIVVDRQHSK